MLFTEIRFYLFLVLVFSFYQFFPKKHKGFLLLLASYIFYMFLDIRFISLLLISTLTDFVCGQLVTRKDKIKKLALFFSLFINLGLLFSFKYLKELIKQINFFLDWNLPIYEGFLSGAFPIGISFYTFQTLSYTIDCYKEKFKPIKSFPLFALYVSFFPQLLAGPIERPSTLIPQLKKLEKIKWINIKQSIPIFFWAGFKKNFVAGNIYPMLQTVFLQPQLNLYEILLASFLITLVVYCDFSAYSDFARATAKIINVDLNVNFRPYIFSKNPEEFWKSWHLSLTEWIRDYVFFPLVRTKIGRRHTSSCFMVVFLLVGLWHGAEWTWLAWGLSAFYFFILFREVIKKSSFLNTSFLTVPLMFLMYILLGFFHELRFLELPKLTEMDIKSLGEFVGIIKAISPFLLPFLIYEFFIFKTKEQEPILKASSFLKGIFYAMCVFGIFFQTNNLTNFIYFGF